ncbi:LysM peptidoglycan-binding domain-containing protein [Granulosicoccaceae sp. 1_MG-2023]|nr:LysM peptidoglycan-binding domain-containing protein [Granulosicoccaceae sp. 1_MG-2023]
MAYIVQSGDSLSAIARKTTGDGDNWRAIAQYNDIRNPNHLRVGDPLMIPGELLPPEASPLPVAQTLPAPPELAEIIPDEPPASPAPDNSTGTQADDSAAMQSLWVVVEGSYYPKAIYERPAYTGDMVTRVLPGTTLKYLGQNTNWIHVQTEKGPGYLHENDARLLGPDETQSRLSDWL